MVGWNQLGAWPSAAPLGKEWLRKYMVPGWNPASVLSGCLVIARRVRSQCGRSRGNYNCYRLGTGAPSYPTASDLKANLWLLLFSENQSVEKKSRGSKPVM